MLNSLDTQHNGIIAMLNEIGGDLLKGSGFEAEDPEPGFIDGDVEGKE